MARPPGWRPAAGERRVLVVRRHWWFVLRPALPVLGLWLLLALLAVASMVAGAQASMVGFLTMADLLLCVLLTLRWAAMTLLPWYHDLYVITNQRVLDQSGLVTLRRREASLLRLNESNYTITGAAARVLDYGDLTMVTAGAQGSITFHQVAHPRRLHALLAAQVRAARDEANNAAPLPSASAATQYLQRIIHGDDAARSFEPTQRVAAITPLAARVQSRLNLLPGETVVRAVRRHPIFLLRRIALPLLAVLALVAAPVFWGGDTLALAAFGAGLVVLAWIAWHIVDWANDMYIVTTERLIELERTPLIFEMRNVVQLRSIQDILLVISTASGRLLDLGNLVVETSGNKNITLRGVPHPEEMQAIIFEGIEAVRHRERARENDQLAGTLSDWFREYHRLRGDADPGPLP